MSPPSSSALVALLVAGYAVAAILPGQTVQFADLGRSPRLPGHDLFGPLMATGDVDGDGDLDLLVGRGGAGGDELWINDGRRRFTVAGKARFPQDREQTRGVALADLDGDGDLDAVLAKYGQLGAQSRLYLNDGTGSFSDATAQRLPSDLRLASGVLVGDLDRDFDLDLVLTGTATCSPCPGDPPRLYLNDGSGTFRDVSATHLPQGKPVTAGAALGDVDGDGDLDLVLANLRTSWNGSGYINGQDFLYLNDGNGRFRDATNQLPVDNAQNGAVVLIDVDRDGDLDLVRAGFDNDTTPPSPIPSLYLNDGTGRFRDATATRMPPLLTISVRAADVDGDGDVDLLFGARADQFPSWPYLLLNDGAGTFALAPPGSVPPAPNCLGYDAVVFADLDGDRRPDALLAAWQRPARSFWNEGGGRLRDPNPPGFPACPAPVAFALGDIDGDGDLDVAMASSSATYWSTNRILVGDGRGGFVDTSERSLPRLSTVEWTRALVLTDVDGDRDLDLITGSSPVANKSGSFGGENLVYRNDGTGRFTVAGSPADRDPTAALAAGDLDGDGDVDLIAVNGDAVTRVYLNDGTGTFTELVGAIAAPTARRETIALGDVDGDGDLDVLLGNAAQDELLLNDGRGRFTDVTATHLPRDAARTYAVALLDFDGDGDLDAVLANTGAPSRAWRNVGGGRYADISASGLPVSPFLAGSLSAGDVDEDGDVDLLFGVDQLYLNDGSGTFRGASDRMAMLPPLTLPVAALFDRDGDGDLDVFATTPLTNLHRHVHAPAPAFVGTDLPIELFAQPGYGTLTQAGVLLISGRLLTPPVTVPPLGRLGIDPRGAFTVGPISLQPPQGHSTVTLPVPDMVRLRDTDLFVQALLAPASGLAGARFTNVIAVRVH